MNSIFLKTHLFQGFINRLFEFEDLKFYFLLFSYGQAGRDDSRTPEQQQYPVQSTGQAVHTEDPGPAPSKIHKPEKQQRQRRRQSDPGERNDPRAFLTFHRKNKKPRRCPLQRNA